MKSVTNRVTSPSRRRLLLAGAASGSLLAGGCSVLPAPLEDSDMDQRVQRNVRRLIEIEAPVTGPISLYEAMARALKFNLDYRVAMMEEAVRGREIDRARMEMLPQWVANAGYLGRDNDAGGSSLSLLTRRQSLEPSTSIERETVSADLSLSWDLLDFGLSYARARQAADNRLVSLENRRKVANRMIEDVRIAYWRAVSAHRLLQKLRQLGDSVDQALADSVELEQRREADPIAALTYQRELLDVQRQVQGLQRELVIAKAQLAALMNLRPGVDFDLVVPALRSAPADLCSGTDALVRAALMNRPELREIAYRTRMNDSEGEAAWLRQFPSLKTFFGANYDSNDYLYHQNWVGWGMRTSWNVMNVFRYPTERKVIEAQGEWLNEREQALTMTVFVQVHVSRAQLAFAREALQTAQRYAEVQDRLVELTRVARLADRESPQRLVREELNGLLAEIRYDLAYADTQSAYANLYSSIGLDSFTPDISGRESVDDLSAALRSLWERRRDPYLMPDVAACHVVEPRPGGQP